jgi:hypothetical protein
MKPAGYFNVPRSIFADPFFEEGQPMTRREAYEWLLAAAAYEPTRVRVNTARSFEIITLQRGQLAHSTTFMMAAWKWSSRKKVRTFLDQLEHRGYITRQRGHQSSALSDKLPAVITICNYDVFQLVTFAGEREEKPARPTAGRQTDHQKGHQAPLQTTGNKGILESAQPIGANNGPSNGPQYKELKKNIYAEDFEAWYALYPRRVSKAAAQQAFTKAVPSRVSLHALMEATKAFAARWAKRPEADHNFIPYPATWLNKALYDDEQLAKPAKPVQDPSTLSDAEWSGILHWSMMKGGDWRAIWGPAPGKPGCLAPMHRLITYAHDGRWPIGWGPKIAEVA